MSLSFRQILRSPEELFARFFRGASTAPAPLPSRPLPPAPAPPVAAPQDQVALAPVGRALSTTFLHGLTQAAPPQKVVFQKPVQLQAGVNMYTPQNPIRANGQVDIVIQFRGDVPARFSEGGVPAVVISAETEGLSAAMMEKFGQASFVPHIIEKAMARLRQQYGPDIQPGRLALGSFSAGYAPLQVALANPAVRARTDAVLVIDGIHYGKAGQPNPEAHQPFVDFAQAAARGEKMMVITHSAIQPTYASSTDAANYILTAAGATRQPAPAESPHWANRYGERPAPETRADRGDLHVEGFKGSVARSHVEQIDNLGNLWSRYLAPRWAEPR